MASLSEAGWSARLVGFQLVDMPDRDIDLFIKFIMQNEGTLSPKKREKFFLKLTDEEIEEMRKVVVKFMLSKRAEE